MYKTIKMNKFKVIAKLYKEFWKLKMQYGWFQSTILTLKSCKNNTTIHFDLFCFRGWMGGRNGQNK